MKPASSPQDQDIIQILKDLESIKSQYPPELLAARRAAFLDKVVQHTQVENKKEQTSKDQSVTEHLKNLGSIQVEYPPELLNARRSGFKRQLTRVERMSLWDSLRSAIQTRFAYLAGASSLPTMKLMQISLVIASIAIAAFFGFSLQGNRGEVANFSPSQNGVSRVVPISATSTPDERVICKPGYQPPLCLAREFDKSRDLTFPGNGPARPAVAKDTMPGREEIHHPAYVNDGLYGPGASWVSNSPDSWIKIDLGKATAINTVAFGRDRLGKLNDGDPGQFVIAVALSDNVYADGNSSNDNLEYVEIFDSEEVGFSGTVSGPETVEAQFQPQVARFIKITFENPGTAIDEVEVFMVQPPVQGATSTKKPQDELPANTLTSIPSSTPLPTNTPLPTETSTPIPTDTPLPTDTPTPVPTDTPIPIPTDTPAPTFTVPFVPDTPPHTPTDIPFLTDTSKVNVPPGKDKANTSPE